MAKTPKHPRCPTVLPAGYSKKEYLALQAKWDAKLKNDGFEDIEQGQDLNKLSTLTIDNIGDHDSIEAIAESADSPLTHLVDSPTYKFWARVGEIVAALPQNHSNRRFFELVAETGNIKGSADKCGLERSRARYVFAKLLQVNGLDKAGPGRFKCPK